MILSYQNFRCNIVCTFILIWTLITISSRTIITTSCWSIRPISSTRTSRMMTTTMTINSKNRNPVLLPLSISSLRVKNNNNDYSLYPGNCRRSTSSCLYVSGNRNKLPIIDAETTDDVVEDNDDNNNNDDIQLSKQRPKIIQDPNIVSSSKSLIDVALETSSDYWKDIRVPFVEPIISSSSSISTDNNSNSNNIEDGVMNYIDVKIAFIASIEGQQYAIATPYDAAVAIMVEDYSTGSTSTSTTSTNTRVQYLSPDNDDNVEIMEIMANRLQDSFGTDVFLKRTPRILTISGPLEENYMSDWQSLVSPQPLSSTELLKVVSTNTKNKNDNKNNIDSVTENTEPKNGNNNDDEYVEYFHQFMKKELGTATFNKIMKDGVDKSDDDDDELTKALAQALNINLDDEDDDDDNENGNDDDFMNTKIDIALQSIMNNLDDDTIIEKELANILSESESSSSSSSRSRPTTNIKNMNTQGIAIKLISFIIPSSGSTDESVQKRKSKSITNNNKSKAYSLVKLIKPHVLVARMINPNGGSTSDDDDDDDDAEKNNSNRINNNIRFDLLLYDEERIVLPKIEEIFYKELNDSGLSNKV